MMRWETTMTQYGFAWRTALGAIGLSLLLGACTNDGTGVINPERAHKINVTSHYVTTSVALGNDYVLEPAESAKLAGLMADFMRSGGGTLDIAVPRGGDAAAKAKVVSDFALGAGARQAELQVRFTEVAASEPVVVSYERFVATPPNCNPTQEHAGFNPRNLRQDVYGCVTQHNLATMVANPADLVRMKRETDADSIRRTTNVQDYREGDSPASADATEAGSAASF
jgi:pilus assembly protein CpaD